MRLLSCLGVLIAINASLLACGGGEGPTGETASEIGDATFPLDPGAAKITVHAYGEGDVPAGSSCAPGEELYTLEKGNLPIDVERCEGAPLHLVHYRGRLASAQRGAVDAVARSLVLIAAAPSATTTCGPTIPMNAYMTVSTWSGADLRSVWGNVAYGCDGSSTHVQGGDRFLAVLRGVTATTTLQAVPEPGASAPLAEGVSIWSPESRAFSITDEGGGLTPRGSDCLPGSKTYALHLVEGVDDGRAYEIAATTCEPLARLLRRHTVLRRFSHSEVEGILTALRATKRTDAATCAPVNSKHIDVLYASPIDVAFADASAICGDDAMRVFQPVSGLDAVFTAIEQLLATSTAKP